MFIYRLSEIPGGKYCLKRNIIQFIKNTFHKKTYSEIKETEHKHICKTETAVNLDVYHPDDKK